MQIITKLLKFNDKEKISKREDTLYTEEQRQKQESEQIFLQEITLMRRERNNIF